MRTLPPLPLATSTALMAKGERMPTGASGQRKVGKRHVRGTYPEWVDLRCARLTVGLLFKRIAEFALTRALGSSSVLPHKMSWGGFTEPCVSDRAW